MAFLSSVICGDRNDISYGIVHLRNATQNFNVLWYFVVNVDIDAVGGEFKGIRD